MPGLISSRRREYAWQCVHFCAEPAPSGMDVSTAILLVKRQYRNIAFGVVRHLILRPDKYVKESQMLGLRRIANNMVWRTGAVVNLVQVIFVFGSLLCFETAQLSLYITSLSR